MKSEFCEGKLTELFDQIKEVISTSYQINFKGVGPSKKSKNSKEQGH